MPRAYDMTTRSAAVTGTRRRIGAAALELFKEREYDAVSLNDIARAAEVSHQTVLNHCGSKGGVVLAAGEVFTEQVEHLWRDALPGDLESVVHTTVVRYEILGDANARWAMLNVPEVAERVAHGREYFQAWLSELLDDLLPEDEDERRDRLFGLHAALDVFTWKLLRRDLGLSIDETGAQMLRLAEGVLR